MLMFSRWCSVYNDPILVKYVSMLATAKEYQAVHPEGNMNICT